MRSQSLAITSTRAVVLTPVNQVDYQKACVLKVLTGGSTVYVGGPDVTTTNGFPIEAGEALSMDVVNEKVWAVAVSTATLKVLERGVLGEP